MRATTSIRLDDVLQQAAVIGVMVLDPRRGAAELAHQFVVDQEALGQVRAGADRSCSAEHLAQPGHEFIDLHGRQAA